MQRVDGVFLALKPIARNVGKNDLHESVFPGERLPIRNQGRGLRAEIGPNQSSMRLDRISRDLHFVLEAGLRVGDVFVGLLGAGSMLVEEPAVIVAAQTALLDESIRGIRPAMGAMAVDQTVSSAQ